MARVDRIEITRHELVTELQAGKGGASIDDSGLRTALIDRLIDRKLLARAADQALVERTPAFLALRRRDQDVLLAGLFEDRLTAGLPLPAKAEIDRYIASHPDQFAQRRQYLVDRISTLAPATALSGTIDQFAAALQEGHMSYERRKVLLDTATLAPAERARLAAARPGEVMVDHARAGTVATAVIGQWPVHDGDAAIRAQARDAIQADRAAQLKANTLTTLRAQAHIAIARNATDTSD